MKKILFFIPAIILSIFYSGITIGARPSVISPIIFLWVGLFTLSGILLSKGLFWGGMFGVLPGIHLMYMSTVDTGQIMHIELPLGIIVLVYYLICLSVVFYKNQRKKAYSQPT